LVLKAKRYEKEKRTLLPALRPAHAKMARAVEFHLASRFFLCLF